MHVADDDPGQVTRIADRLEPPDDALSDIEQDGRVRPLDEESGRRGRRMRHGRAAAEDGQAEATGGVGNHGVMVLAAADRCRPPDDRKAVGHVTSAVGGT